MKSSLKYAVIGSGSWATAIIKILNDNSRSVNWYIRNSENIDYINKHHHNPSYLSSVELNTKKIKKSSDINVIVKDVDVLIRQRSCTFNLLTLKNETCVS